jgi:hypothetical protein
MAICSIDLDVRRDVGSGTQLWKTLPKSPDLLFKLVPASSHVCSEGGCGLPMRTG